MKAETREWARFAEIDFDAATSLMKKRKKLPANIVGFLSQQCAEKYLKARMVEDGVPVLKTHDLQVLLNFVIPSQPLWAAFHTTLGNLTSYAVKFRYPGHVATRADAQEALNACRSIRSEVRLSLGFSKK